MLISLDGADYVSKWGLADFYPEVEKLLRALIASGKNFETDWFGCQKEIRYAKYVKDDDGFHISVSCHMDDLYDGGDLIDDALYEIGVGGELMDEQMDDIITIASERGIEDVSYQDVSLPRNASYEDIVKYTQKCEDIAERNNREMFNALCEIVKGVVCGVEE